MTGDCQARFREKGGVKLPSTYSTGICMNRLKFLRSLFVLFTVLTVVFGIGLIVPENRDNTLGRVGLWCGFIAMLVDAIVTYTEIRKIKKGEDS